MSQQNVQVVRSVIDAYFRGDQPAMLELAEPDIVVTQLPDQPDVRDYRGHAGLLQAMSDWVEAWDDWSIEVLSVKDIGEHVLVAAHQRGSGRGSGAPIAADVSFVFTVGAGKIARWQIFRTEAQALAAIGDSE
jgi:ketosteroid isomerase-like protein